MRSQSSAGRYFPIAPSRLVALMREWPLNGGIGSEPRRLRNPKRTELTPPLLAILRPGTEVTIYSLPIHVDPELGERAVTKALEVLARWKADAEDTEGHSRVILAYLHGETELRFLDERLKYARRKFGAGEGLSSSRKPKVTSRSITELAKVDLD